jgi:hypothetical protein
MAAALATCGAAFVANEAACTSLPAAALHSEQLPGLDLLRALPLVTLYSGFCKFEIQGVRGVWMRTFGNHLFGIPDLAHLAGSHQHGEHISSTMDDIMRHLLASGRTLAPGHTMDVGWTVLRARAPVVPEYFLESRGEMLVLESIPGDVRS